MNIVADENLDKQIVARLRADGHDVSYIAELDPGIDDDTVLRQSRVTNAILLTADKDFGELVFRQRQLHSGVVLIRLSGLTPGEKAGIVAAAFQSHGQAMRGQFAVVSERSIRIRGTQIAPGSRSR